MKRILPFVIIALVLCAGLFMAFYLKRSSDSAPSRTTQDSSIPRSQTGPAKLGANPPYALGAMDAPVMIEEFGDFECPPCGQLHPILKAMKAEYGSRLVIVFREFPMTSLHPHAVAAARAAEAAGLQGKFWEMHDLLYENQSAWHEASDAEPLFEQYAMRTNLDLDRFRRDMASHVVDQRIQLDRERGVWIGVQGTPTVFLNGREVPFESLNADGLARLISDELSKANNP
jgi:protein-disulfide isomerase